jgi:serine/threonine-protein kinase
VAVKLLRRDLSSHADAVRQLRREPEALARLNHPNIIKIFDARLDGAVGYLAMEYVEGTDLHHFVAANGPLPVEQACDTIRQVAQGLQHTHQLGLVHRDIKPANLFLARPPEPLAAGRRTGPEPVVKVLDWGLARVMPAPGEVIDTSGADYQAERGRLIGTADYIAPEQAQDPWLVDTRADIYSLGCAFYFLLTGQPPFPGASLMRKLIQHQEAEPPSVRAVREVPEELDAMVRRMLAKKPEERFQIPLLVAAALRPFCAAGWSGNGVVRPPSSGTVSALRPSGSDGLSRPSTVSNLKPSTLTNLKRPSSTGG